MFNDSLRSSMGLLTGLNIELELCSELLLGVTAKGSPEASNYNFELLQTRWVPRFSSPMTCSRNRAHDYGTR